MQPAPTQRRSSSLFLSCMRETASEKAKKQRLQFRLVGLLGMSSWPQCTEKDIFENMSSGSSEPSSSQMVAAANDDILVFEDSVLEALGAAGLNLSSSASEVNQLIGGEYFWWKTFLLTWDFIGLLINGLGIDMLWHGVEVNHAVYALILQDICLAWISTLISSCVNWLVWADDCTWFRFHSVCGLVPILFHDWAWASVAYLRSVNITKNDIWLELDQVALRCKITWMTWFALIANIVGLMPFAIFIKTDQFFSLSVIGVFLFVIQSFAVALFYYLKILNFSRNVAEEYRAAVDAANAAAASNQPPNEAQGQHQVDNIFDDSDDDDLLDPSESPSAKQESAVFMALKTMALLALIQLVCIGIMAVPDENTWKYAFLGTLIAITRQPVILGVCVINFGPIRNTVALYVENLPDHIMSSFDPIVDWWAGCQFGSTDHQDQRSFVEASHDELNGERAGHSPIVSRAEGRPNIVGKRDSAVSPANSNDSLNELPAVQC